MIRLNVGEASFVARVVSGIALVIVLAATSAGSVLFGTKIIAASITSRDLNIEQGSLFMSGDKQLWTSATRARPDNLLHHLKSNRVPWAR